MDCAAIIRQTEEYVKSQMSCESAGHDWWHTWRVCNNAAFIAKKENADLFVVRIAALLHDIADHKFHGGDESIGPMRAKEWLEKSGADDKTISHVCEIIKDMSFKGAGVKTGMKTLEGKVVQDADRLDAIGAIGIARTFAYGGYRGQEMHNPEIPPQNHASFEQYKNSRTTTINHFYEKLLLLKSLMNTETAKTMANERHKFMEQFLDRFLKEWN